MTETGAFISGLHSSAAAGIGERAWPGWRGGAPGSITCDVIGTPRNPGLSWGMSSMTIPIGDHLRQWRQRRRMSQLDLACEAEISTKHLSFLEIGRSEPSRDMVLHLRALMGM